MITPPNNLTKWGTTSPTKPIIPDNETLAPTAAAQVRIILYFNFFTSTPNLKPLVHQVELDQDFLIQSSSMKLKKELLILQESTKAM